MKPQSIICKGTEERKKIIAGNVQLQERHEM
jgi:hypothetical protein